MKICLLVVLVAVNVLAIFACTIEQELALLQAIRGLKECKKCALMNLIKPDCKGLAPAPLVLPKWKWAESCDWGKQLAPPLAPLVFLLPGPGLPQQLQPLPQLQSPAYLPQPPVNFGLPKFLPAPPPPTCLTPPKACEYAAPPQPSCLASKPIYEFVAPPSYAVPQPSYAVPQPSYAAPPSFVIPPPAPAPVAVAPQGSCAAPQPQQTFYLPQQTCQKPPSPLLFLSKKGCA